MYVCHTVLVSNCCFTEACQCLHGFAYVVAIALKLPSADPFCFYPLSFTILISVSILLHCMWESSYVSFESCWLNSYVALNPVDRPSGSPL